MSIHTPFAILEDCFGTVSKTDDFSLPVQGATDGNTVVTSTILATKFNGLTLGHSLSPS
jgi:hypothetical protein